MLVPYFPGTRDAFCGVDRRQCAQHPCIFALVGEIAPLLLRRAFKRFPENASQLLNPLVDLSVCHRVPFLSVIPTPDDFLLKTQVAS